MMRCFHVNHAVLSCKRCGAFHDTNRMMLEKSCSIFLRKKRNPELKFNSGF